MRIYTVDSKYQIKSNMYYMKISSLNNINITKKYKSSCGKNNLVGQVFIVFPINSLGTGGGEILDEWTSR